MKRAKIEKPVPKKGKSGRPKGSVTITIDQETKEAVKTIQVTPRQAKLIQIAKENVRKGQYKSKREMLELAGYSQGKAETPSKVTNSKTMQDILATQLTDKQLVDNIEKTFADKNEILKFPIHLDDEDIKYIVEQNGVDKLVKLCTSPDNSHKIAYISKPDKDIILKAADIAFKLKGSYAPTKTDNTNKNVDLVALFLASQKNQNETDTL